MLIIVIKVVVYRIICFQTPDSCNSSRQMVYKQLNIKVANLKKNCGYIICFHFFMSQMKNMFDNTIGYKPLFQDVISYGSRKLKNCQDK